MNDIKVVDLSGWAYRELGELASALAELADKGSIEGVTFDLDTLHASFNPRKPEVYIYDEEGNCWPNNGEEE